MAPGSTSFGLDPDAVVLIRTDTIVELLWAMEEAIACRAVAAVVADIGTATTRRSILPRRGGWPSHCQRPALRCSSSATGATAKPPPPASDGGSSP